MNKDTQTIQNDLRTGGHGRWGREIADHIDQLEADKAELVAQTKMIESAANFLLVWRHQDNIDVDKMPAGGWHVSNLHPDVWNKMDSGERDLYQALMAKHKK